MSIVVACECGKSFQAKPELAGKRVKCPACGSALSIPSPPPARAAVTADGANSQGIRVDCSCGKAFKAKAEMAGKKCKCPACGTVLEIPAAGGVKPKAAARPAVAADPFGMDPLAGDPFGGSSLGSGPLDLGGLDANAFGGGIPASLPASPQLAQPASRAATFAGQPAAKGSSSNKGLIIGLIFGGVALMGLICVVLLALLLPAVQAARQAAQRARERNEARMASTVTPTVPSTVPSTGGATNATPANPGDTWITHTSSGDGYSISMPKRPMPQTQAKLGMIVNMAICDLGPPGAYFVAASNLPFLGPDMEYDADLTLEESVKGALASTNGQLVSSKNVAIDGHAGREITFTGQKGPTTFTATARIYLVGTTIYQNMFIGHTGKTPVADVQKFFDSFKLIERPAAPAASAETPVEPPVAPESIPPTPAANTASSPPAISPPAISPIGQPAGEPSGQRLAQMLGSADRTVQLALSQAEELEKEGQIELAKTIRTNIQQWQTRNDENLVRIFNVTPAELKRVREENKAKTP